MCYYIILYSDIYLIATQAYQSRICTRPTIYFLLQHKLTSPEYVYPHKRPTIYFLQHKFTSPRLQLKSGRQEKFLYLLKELNFSPGLEIYEWESWL